MSALVVVAAVAVPLAEVSQRRPAPACAGRATDLRHIDRALAAGDVPRALVAWERARAAARASHCWDALIAVADAYLRIGDAVQFRRAFVTTARDTYLEALERARRSTSLAGALRVAEALETLHDRAAAAQAVGVACRVVLGARDATGANTVGECDRLAAALGETDRRATGGRER